MATVKLILDTRSTKIDEENNKLHPIKLRISHKGKNIYIGLGVDVEETYFKNGLIQKCKKYPTPKRINHTINSRLVTAQDYIDNLHSTQRVHAIPIKIIKQEIESKFSGQQTRNTFSDFYQNNFLCIIKDTKSKGTHGIYEGSYNKCMEFSKGQTIFFEDVTYEWLNKFDAFLIKKGNKGATRGIVFRNIRAVFNSAMKAKKVSRDMYPFYDFEIPQGDVNHIGLTSELIRQIQSLTFDDPYYEYVRDTFALSFLLIGINNSDLYDLKEIKPNGRIEYNRNKTNKHYSVLPHPYVLHLAKKWPGKNTLFCFADRYRNPHNFTNVINKKLKTIGERIGVPDLRMYHARHTWATIASELDIPKETISAALGHSEEEENTKKKASGNVTDIYIKFNYKKVDEANLKIINHLRCFN